VLDVSDYNPHGCPQELEGTHRKDLGSGPLSGPRCGNEMKIISLIHEPDVIARILRHLALWNQHPDPHDGKTKLSAHGRLSSRISTMAGPGMNSRNVYH